MVSGKPLTFRPELKSPPKIEWRLANRWCAALKSRNLQLKWSTVTRKSILILRQGLILSFHRVTRSAEIQSLAFQQPRPHLIPSLCRQSRVEAGSFSRFRQALQATTSTITLYLYRLKQSEGRKQPRKHVAKCRRSLQHSPSTRKSRLTIAFRQLVSKVFRRSVLQITSLLLHHTENIQQIKTQRARNPKR